MASDTAHRTHPFHLVNPSPWPIVGSIAAACLAVGGILYMHTGFTLLLLTGFGIMIITFGGWWRDVIKEANSGVDHTSVVRTGLRIGMLLFIASEVMFFFAFFWAYFHSSLPLLSNVAGPWPNNGLEPMGPGGIPMLNTLILLTSSCTVTVAHHAILENDRKTLVTWTALTWILGAIFLGFQIYEYWHLVHEEWTIKDGIYPSAFFLATGFHGFHVFVGTTFLIVCWLRARAGHFTPDGHIGFEAAAWYWHFVDVVWVFLYINVYWWGSHAWGHLHPAVQ
jgi:cytochrome c oxidase subunit III